MYCEVYYWSNVPKKASILDYNFFMHITTNSRSGRRCKHRYLNSNSHKRFWTGLGLTEGWYYVMGGPKKIV